MRWALALFALTAVPQLAAAQTFAPHARAEAAAFIDYGTTWDDEGSLGGGSGGAGSVLWHSSPNLAWGVRLERIGHDRETSGGALRFQGTSTVVTGHVLKRFGERRARPFVRGGVGVIYYDATFTSGPPRNLPPFVTPPAIPTIQIHRDASSAVISAATGVDVFVTRWLSVRPDVAFIGTPRPSENWMPHMIWRSGVGVVVHW